MQDSHTAASIDEMAADSSPLRLVGASTAGLPQWLAGWTSTWPCSPRT